MGQMAIKKTNKQNKKTKTKNKTKVETLAEVLSGEWDEGIEETFVQQ